MAKIDVVKQHDLQDCGACSLSCIIRYYGGYVPLEKIREDTCTSKTGSTAFHLIEAARTYGFDALGVKVEDIHDENLYFPAIAHVVLKNGLNHFVVVYKITNKEIYLMDPAKGKVKMKLQDFNAVWDNVIILLTPISEIIKYDKSLTITSLLFKLISNNKSVFVKICIANLLLMIFTIICSFYFQLALKQVEIGEDIIFLKLVICFFSWFTLNKVIISFVKNYYLTYFSKNLDCELFSLFLDHIFHLPLKFIQNRTTGEILSRVQDLSEIKEFLSEFFTNVLLNSVLVVGSVVVLYTLSSRLFFILCIVVILYILIGLIFSKLIYNKVKTSIENATEFNSTLVENIEMNTSIKNLNLVEPFLKRVENKLIIMLKSNFATTKTLNAISILKEGIYELGLFAVTTIGIILIYQGNLELLKFITFNSVILYLFNPIKDMIDLIPHYNYLKASFAKLQEFFNIKKEEINDGYKTIKKGKINFEDVTYSYNHHSLILKNTNFTIDSGEKVMIKGKSGSGKSTICSLLITPNILQSGTIKIDDVNMVDYSFKAIDESILYVGQNEKLFTGTIWENITCFRSVNEEEVLKVAKICKLEDLINSRPNRYHTIINASINNLSGGEKERIILARALLKKSKIIILDEALSEVNIDIEKEIIDNIFKYFKNSTIIYISHKDVTNKFPKVLDMEKING